MNKILKRLGSKFCTKSNQKKHTLKNQIGRWQKQWKIIQPFSNELNQENINYHYKKYSSVFKTQKNIGRLNYVIRPTYGFTSSSNPNQVPLLQQVQGKVLQIIKNFKPSLFEQHLNKKLEIKAMDTQEIQVAKILSQDNKINRNIKFQALGFDSLDTTEMIVTMEETFGIQLSDEQARGLETIGMAIDTFFRKINTKITNKIIEREKQMGAMSNPFIKT